VIKQGPTSLAVLRRHWFRALVYAVLANCGFYLLVAFAVQRAGAELAIATVGLLPMCVSVAGNSAFKEAGWNRFLLPFLVFVVGLLIIGWSRISSGFSTSQAALDGIGAVVMAVVGWTWYAVSNAQFLRANNSVSSEVWSSAVGVQTLLVSLAWLLVRLWMNLTGTAGGDQSRSLLNPPFLTMSIVLGVGASWYATVLFNSASKSLPMALVGQLIVFETIFGVGYVYAFGYTPITASTLIGFAVATAGIGWSTYALTGRAVSVAVRDNVRPDAQSRAVSDTR
jgi:drug/metabolite transporter (DMT)-like permease